MKKIHSSHINLAKDWGITQVRLRVCGLQRTSSHTKPQLAKDQVAAAAASFADMLAAYLPAGESCTSLGALGACDHVTG